jgi:hypothetical protein
MHMLGLVFCLHAISALEERGNTLHIHIQTGIQFAYTYIDTCNLLNYRILVSWFQFTIMVLLVIKIVVEIVQMLIIAERTQIFVTKVIMCF